MVASRPPYVPHCPFRVILPDLTTSYAFCMCSPCYFIPLPTSFHAELHSTLTTRPTLSQPLNPRLYRTRSAYSLLTPNLSAILIGQPSASSASSADLLVEWKGENSSEKAPPATKCFMKTRSCSHNQPPITYQLETRQSDCVCKCVDLERDHSAHRVYLNSRTARDRFIVTITF